jgi:hypothetical protein
MNSLIRRQLRHYGLRATATVISRTHRGRWPTGELRDFDYVLAVKPAGEPAFQAQVRDRFSLTGLKPEEGDVDVPVRYDARTKEIAFDLDGDPRYDADAMKARTVEMWEQTRMLKAGALRRASRAHDARADDHVVQRTVLAVPQGPQVVQEPGHVARDLGDEDVQDREAERQGLERNLA